MVHFVGAGPGAADLITVRGERLLKEADVVIYAGSLVNPALLACTKKECRIYNSAHMNLAEVMEVIRRAEKEQKTTVRLHTGDTSVYSTIREQMEELDKSGISYDVIPGVSAFQAAAASLDAELTLPGISQSVILTRGNGRTKVPERESLRSFAGHHATMVLYLSSSLAYEVQRELTNGGYGPDTPVDVVYKASWPDERIIRSTLAEFPERMEEEQITKTALILVGDVLSGNPLRKNFSDNKGSRKTLSRTPFTKNLSDDSGLQMTDARQPAETETVRSRLYDPAFSTAIRRGDVLHIWMAACTRSGTDQMRRLKSGWEAKAASEKKNIQFEIHVKCSAMAENETKSLRRLTQEAFDRSDVMIFFSSTGIAVRSIAPFLRSKMTDPAVLVIDEKGRNCIPLLSGHIGGANEYAEEVEKMIHAHAVVTTATDLERRFSVDVFAKYHDLVISDMEKAKAVSAKVVEGKKILLFCDCGADQGESDKRTVAGELPQGICLTDSLMQADLIVTADAERIREAAKMIGQDGIGLVLIPKLYDLGIGCRKNVSADEMRKAVETALSRLHTVPEAIHAVGSVDLKRDEPAFAWIGRTYHLIPEFFTAEELLEVPGIFTSSEFVKNVTGVDNVCERSAVKLSGGTLVLKKTVCGNVTVAAARRRICQKS